MDLSFIIVQILSALFNNDLSALYLLINSYKNIVDTVGEGGLDDPQAQVNVLKSYVASCSTTELHKSILIQSIDISANYDAVGCLANIAKNLTKHSEAVIEIIKEMELFEVCNGKRASKRYLKHLSDLCSSKRMIITQAGLSAIEEADLLRTHYFVSENGYVSSCGLARMLMLTLCNGAL
uniref:19.7 kDa protein n=1 Tax=Grapevine leafroll-associated virus 3 TaxID=55951 RepID=I3PVA7_9CLOS|nr:19.7 kDa protein [Grapevine leafroll-associated virus 3]